ncbi:MAG TPA: hypothetical protein VGL72_17110 [Bryobacteraceae bacterium]|jgi:hypothetical protein
MYILKARIMEATEVETAPLDRMTEAEWEELAREAFALRQSDAGRTPERRRVSTPVWYPPETGPVRVA